MANQMIALQARGPEMPDMGAQLARFGNMMARQQVANRQSEVAQQAMDIARAVEERVAAAESGLQKGAALERLGKASEIFRNALPGVSFGDVARTTAVRAAVVQMSPELDALLPSVETLTTDRATYDLASMTADILANKRSGAAQVSTVIDPRTNQVMVVNASGMPGGSFSQGIPDISESIPQSPAPQATGGVPPQATGSNNMANPSRGANTTPQDLLGQDVNPNNIPSGNPLQPISMTTGGGDQAAQQNLVAIVQTMMQTRVISQSGLDAMRAAARGKEDQLAQFLSENNIQIMPDEGEAPGMRNAVFRPGVDPTPLRQNMQYAPAQYPRTYGKDPMQAPMPGSAAVPLKRVGDEAAAGRPTPEQAGAVAKATKAAESQAQKDAAFPDVQAQFEAGIALIDNRLADVKRFREHPAASRVIGQLDAFTLNTGRARGAQNIYEALVATATLDELQQMRQNSPTGGALGNVSDADIRILRQSIGALGQDQSEADFNDSLKIFEARLKSTRERMIRRYRENYGYKVGKDFQPPAPTSPRSTSTNGGRKAGGFTVMEVGD